MAERDYVLGTHDEEIERLGVQHRVWRPTVLAAWTRAGIGPGSRVVDVGAGTGYATLDLAERVGATGEVIAVERSQRFLRHAEEACRARGFGHVRFQELDLMTGAIDARDLDAAWCRWVAAFVPEPARIVAMLARALAPGGRAVFHEYGDYRGWRFAPRRPVFESFVERVIEAWRSSGGEPDVGAELPALLVRGGFRVREVAPRVFASRPGDALWEWPARFIESGLRRLIELGHADEAWAERVRAEYRAAEADPATVQITPLVLEIIAERA
ncbi:MAG: methyltransferase domain-containing protein [Candidatus Eisenbacteria bacterium]|nr:methyltransferase domain-containing protein [Candidatus Eisenbacteria bacterium]